MPDHIRPPGQRVTIYDVAHEADVSPSTVSRAFSRPSRVNSETAERIRRVAERLGYRTNPLARALTTSRTQMIALVIADITNPVYAEIVRGAQEVAADGEYTTVLIDAQESDRLERAAVERTMSTVDGIVLASSRMSDSAIRMVAKQRPVVVLNRALADVPCVVTDDPRGVRRAAEHLGELGHDHITYVAGPQASWPNGVRWRSLLEAGMELEIKVRQIGPFSPTLAGGERAAQELCARPATAVLAFNDQMAIGIIRGLSRMGVNVPGDVSVVGFDNILAADIVTPGLTTVAAPLYAEGSAATRHLLTMIEGAPGHTGRPMVLPVRLVVRDSTAVRNPSPGRARPAWVRQRPVPGPAAHLP
ncbi:LacI family DNA-binding transcriptional regulator [Micromonospora noduli]|uniref:Catabolite control protein n=1 Tax=Micromonospora noduli TaxID=709876 RepID=A0A328N2K3_9ACTN|nr:LacI family DNA-binding transcriptional regulator [Micromonospora noduli]KAB1929264.1 LacI family transcriptional regulator [Micromonospora noduli]RAO00910.1 Catabolite control protein [Micromonospora noduli]RAO13535.1 Catabolite control protein [Micromonospora noduli]RAO16332.1 Catabolite control protein [Micromonospora noduli]RAO31919.1 Catabolite control protein [Micromonospora noduli]